MHNEEWYEELMTAHRGLTDAQSQRLNAALVLLLADQLAASPGLPGCIKAARDAALMTEIA
jgi:hypothetical protein